MGHYISFIEEDPGIIMRGRAFIKMHGLRNDFIIVDGRRQPYRPSVDEIVRHCDRREGVGGDELLIIDPPMSRLGGCRRLCAYLQPGRPRSGGLRKRQPLRGLALAAGEQVR